MSKMGIFILAASFIALTYYMQADYEDAMAKCQVKHSFDTCFNSLNR